MEQVAKHEASQREWKFWFWIAATLVSVTSLVSLLQHALQVGVSPLIAEVLAFYRSLIYPVFDLLLFWLPFRLAGSIKDICLASLTAWGIHMRYIWAMPKSPMRSRGLWFYALYELSYFVVGTIVLYVPNKLTFGINTLSLGFEAFEPRLIGFTVVGLLLAPLIGLGATWFRTARNDKLRATPRGREMASFARDSFLSYAYNLGIIAAAAATVFALNFQAP